MGTQPGAIAAKDSDRPIFRLNMQVVARGIEAISRVLNAAGKGLDDDCMMVEHHVMRDDAHPLNYPK